jgi:hypothetical protein
MASRSYRAVAVGVSLQVRIALARLERSLR